MLSRDSLEAEDKVFALVLVLAGGVVVVKVIEEIDLAVKVVEEAGGDAETFIEKSDGSYDGGVEDIFEPCQAWIGYRDAQKYDKVINLGGRGEFGANPLAQCIICVWVVDLVPSSFGAGVDSKKSNAGAQPHIQRPTSLWDVGTWAGPHDET